MVEGPTAAEKAQGYGSDFSSATAGMLRRATVEQFLTELDTTVLPFPPIDGTRYSIEGDQKAFYEWLMRVVPGS